MQQETEFGLEYHTVCISTWRLQCWGGGADKGNRGKNVEKSGMQTGTEAERKTGIDSRRHKQCSEEVGGGVKNQAGGVVVVVGGVRLYF